MVGRSGWDGYSGQAMGDDVKFEHVRENGNISKSFGAGTMSRSGVSTRTITARRPPIAHHRSYLYLAYPLEQSYAQYRSLAIDLEGLVLVRVVIPLSLRIPPTRVCSCSLI